MVSSEDVILGIGASYPHIVSISVFVAVLCLCIMVGHLVEGSRWLNESNAALLIGVSTGIIILLLRKGTSSQLLRFDEELFFIYLLPPIIFNAGFRMKKKQFFRNFSTIVLLGVFGCFVSSGLIATGSSFLLPAIGLKGLKVRDYLALGAIFSSTDTVCTVQMLDQDTTPLLYSLVFGEGVVNDATSVVLLKAIQKPSISKMDILSAGRVIGDFFYLFSTSTALGVATGLVTSFTLKRYFVPRHATDREIALTVLMAYLSYLLAELLSLSGILTVFLCGITMSHYAWHSVKKGSKTTTKHGFATMSCIAETFIFLYVGMDVLDIEKWKTSKFGPMASIEGFLAILGLILLGRAAFVFPVAAFSNYINKEDDRAYITFRDQVIIWWAGLMRGAVSIALAFSQFTTSGITRDPVHAAMVTITSVVVLFTTLVFGSCTKPLINCLVSQDSSAYQILGEQAPSSSREEENIPILSFNESASTNIMRAKGSWSVLIKRPGNTIHSLWREFDDTYMRPVFGGPPPRT